MCVHGMHVLSMYPGREDQELWRTVGLPSLLPDWLPTSWEPGRGGIPGQCPENWLTAC